MQITDLLLPQVYDVTKKTDAGSYFGHDEKPIGVCEVQTEEPGGITDIKLDDAKAMEAGEYVMRAVNNLCETKFARFASVDLRTVSRTKRFSYTVDCARNRRDQTLNGVNLCCSFSLSTAKLQASSIAPPSRR